MSAFEQQSDDPFTVGPRALFARSFSSTSSRLALWMSASSDPEPEDPIPRVQKTQENKGSSVVSRHQDIVDKVVPGILAPIFACRQSRSMTLNVLLLYVNMRLAGSGAEDQINNAELRNAMKKMGQQIHTHEVIILGLPVPDEYWSPKRP